MLDPTHLLNSAGAAVALLVLGVMIFAESGLLVGFFLPGDTLLFPAGFFAGQGKFSLTAAILVAWLAATLGNEMGYTIGQKTGPRLFNKKDSVVFRQEYLARAKGFYDRHGSKTILLARFLPIVRTFAPLIAGAAAMERRKFTVFNALGGGLWVTTVMLLGYWLGNKIPNIDHYLLPAVLAATVLTFGPTLFHILRDKRLRSWLGGQWKRIWKRIG